MALQQQPNLTIEWEEEDELGYVIKLVAKIKKDIADIEKELLSSVHSKTLLAKEEDLGVGESGAVNATQGNIADLGGISSCSDNVPSKTVDERQNERSREEQDQPEMNAFDKKDIAEKDKLVSSVHSKTSLAKEEGLGVGERGAVNATQGNIADLGGISSCSDIVASKTVDERQNERSREEQDQPEMKAFDKDSSGDIDRKTESLAILSKATTSQSLPHGLRNNMERSIQSKQEQLNNAKIGAERCKVELENLKRCMDTIKAWGIIRTVVSQLYCPIPSDLLRPVMRKLRAMLQEQMNTHGVKLKMPIYESAQGLEKDMPLIVICLQSTRLGTDISCATKGIEPGPNVAVLILHHADSHALPFKRSCMILTAPEYKQIDTMVDMGFLSPTGIYDCDMNKNALKVPSTSHPQNIMMQLGQDVKRQSRETMLRLQITATLTYDPQIKTAFLLPVREIPTCC